MKHSLLVTPILLLGNYFTVVLAEKIEDTFAILSHGMTCRSFGGQCRRRNILCDDGYEETLPGKPFCKNKKKKCCYPHQRRNSGNTKDLITSMDTIFIGPYNNVWSIQQCPIKGWLIKRDLSDCKLHCAQQGYNALAIGEFGRIFVCILYKCDWPVPLPDWSFPPFQGYAIAEVCGTDSKCGIRGGFCITEDEVCNGNTIMGEGYCNANYKDMSCKCCFTPTVYMQDIENTIGYAFRNRAPYEFWGPPQGYRTLNSTVQKALSEFARTLIEHLPLRHGTARHGTARYGTARHGMTSPPLVNFLICFKDKLPYTTISGENLMQIYDDCTNENSILPEVYITPWVNCRNTNDRRIEQLRTYPCGVWITFHAITVSTTDQDASTILPTLHEFVKYFPWCTDCRAHFMEMYENLRGQEMDTAESVILWLWRAHNKVSVRVQDGFDVKNRTLDETNCKPFSPELNKLQTLESACKFECKVNKIIMKDCKYTTIPSDKKTCQICSGDQIREETSAYVMYVLNTATETPGRRKSLFPEFKLCEHCWQLVLGDNKPFEFMTKTNEKEVLSFLNDIYKAENIVRDS